MNKEMKIQPVISEKSYNLANSENKYTFFVPKDMSKIAVAGEIEKAYKVKVVTVNVVVKPGKLKRDWKYGTYSRKSDMKKAVVQVKSGDKINDFFNI